MSNKSGTSIITQPSSRSISNQLGEKFSPNPFTGTGNYSVPITLPPGLNGFQPELNIQYSSGGGNSPLGLGWSLSTPGIMRQTTKGIPKYQKDDVFILSGVKDLIPIDFQTNRIQYCSRAEGLFAKIYHYQDASNNYWEVETREGITSFYGTPNSLGNDPATCFDPRDKRKIFEWKLSKKIDLFGNIIEYEYERNIDQQHIHYFEELYLAKIRYINSSIKANSNFLVTVHFVCEGRPDPFSSFCFGHEVRTTKRYKHIEIYNHHVPDTLVRTYGFIYLDERVSQGEIDEDQLPLNGVSLLSQLLVTGYEDGEPQPCPPKDFGYSRFEFKKREFVPIRGQHLPNMSLAHPNIEVADLLGNGLPDILEMNGVIRYWRNLGNGEFSIPNLMNGPGGLSLGDSDVQLIDANGDGRVDLMVNKGGLFGYFPSKFIEGWHENSFKKYKFAPNFSFQDPEVQLLDLTGDGVTDVIRSSSCLECYFNDAEKGWSQSSVVNRHHVDDFPNISFSDPRLKWANMNGDNLQDMVIFNNDSVDYWANMGYGYFSKKIRMRNCPHFPYMVDYSRILLGDIDGDGLTDIVYVDNNEITLWINQSGNSWSEPITIRGSMPLVTNMDSIRLEDFFGIGVKGVLWTADRDALNRPYNYFFLDLTGGLKPYLLTEMNNNKGTLTKVGYHSSIKDYLEDERNPETHWKTNLPFPVQTVSRIEVIDQTSKGKLTTEYHYHHGYYDGNEREFRGFSKVDKFDSEI